MIFRNESSARLKKQNDYLDIMTTLIIKIDKETPEVKKTIDFLNTLDGVTITTKGKAATCEKNAWDKAIANGAVTVDEFIEEVKKQLRTHYDNA